MSSVAVIDYGMGNLHSISKALQHADPRCWVIITDDRDVMAKADRVVFPGVGAIRDCMEALRGRDLVPVIQQLAVTKPFLGICLGMQALLSESEENGSTRCLDIIPGAVKRFAPHLQDAGGHTLKIPHMGWNRVHQRRAHPLWNGIPDECRFYFVHSYYAYPTHDADVAATSDYPEPFAAAVARANIFAVQFHPEKSQAVGLRLLSNFLSWNPDSEAVPY